MGSQYLLVHLICSFLYTVTQYQEEDEEEKSEKNRCFRQTNRRNLDALPLKARLLHSEDLEEMIEAASYFRKVLATGKKILKNTVNRTENNTVNNTVNKTVNNTAMNPIYWIIYSFLISHLLPQSYVTLSMCPSVRLTLSMSVCLCNSLYVLLSVSHR